MDLNKFKNWLIQSTDYSAATIGDIVSRFKRATNMLDWYNEPVYLFNLEQTQQFRLLSPSVKSQIKKAVKLYSKYINEVQE